MIHNRDSINQRRGAACIAALLTASLTILSVACAPLGGIRPAPYAASSVSTIEVRVLPTPPINVVSEQLRSHGSAYAWLFLLLPRIGTIALVEAETHSEISKDRRTASELVHDHLAEFDPSRRLAEGLSSRLNASVPGVFKVSEAPAKLQAIRTHDAVVNLQIKDWGVVDLSGGKSSPLAIAFAVVQTRMEDSRGNILWDETVSASAPEWREMASYRGHPEELQKDMDGIFQDLVQRISNTLIYQRRNDR